MLWWDFEFEEQSARACENWMVPSRSASDLWPPLLPASARPFSTTSPGVTPFLSRVICSLRIFPFGLQSLRI